MAQSSYLLAFLLRGVNLNYPEMFELVAVEIEWIKDCFHASGLGVDDIVRTRKQIVADRKSAPAAPNRLNGCWQWPRYEPTIEKFCGALRVAVEKFAAGQTSQEEFDRDKREVILEVESFFGIRFQE